MDKYILILYFDLITSISLVTTENLITKKRLSKVERSKLIIEYPINEIIVGLLLGDGHIQKRTINGNSRFIYGQSSLRKHHLNYFNHILELFKPYLSKDFNLKEKIFTDKRTNKIYSSVNFATLTLPCFNLYKNQFYNSNNLKIVPNTIQNLLTPLLQEVGLAYWIMDDGSIQNKGLHLNTYGFTNEDILKLKKTLETMFGTMPCNCKKIL